MGRPSVRSFPFGGVLRRGIVNSGNFFTVGLAFSLARLAKTHGLDHAGSVAMTHPARFLKTHLALPSLDLLANSNL